MTFRVLPSDPQYLLQSPDQKETPFPGVLGAYTGMGREWLDLRPQMRLRIENAYFREGAPRSGMHGFIGTEVADYRATANGKLRLLSLESKVPQHPNDQPPVQELLPVSIAAYRFHRYFYQIGFNRSAGEIRGAVLLGARSSTEMAALSSRLLTDPDAVCGGKIRVCAIFPETCTVSIEMEIIVNGAPRTVRWGSLLSSVMVHPRQVQMMRPYDGRLTPVKIDPRDPKTLQLPLLPGDHIDWE